MSSNDPYPELTYADGRKIPESEFNQLPPLLPEILGVRYVNETSSVQILLQVTFPLLRKEYISYAQLRLQALSSKDPVVHMQVKALTPAVQEKVVLGHYTRNKCKCWMWCLGASVSTGVEEGPIAQCLTPYILPEGHSLWNFDNELMNWKELRLLYPPLCLIAEFDFPPKLVKDKAPFYLVFSSDCKMTFMDRIGSIIKDALGKYHYQYEILGQYREDIVEEHIREKKCGLRAATERQRLRSYDL